MRALRATLRLVLAALLIASLFAVWFVGLIFVGLWPRARVRWRLLVFRAITRSLLAILGARVEVWGEPPSAPFLLVANHQSYVDVLVLASRLDIVFVAKSEVADWPVLGVLCRLMGTIFIDRKRSRDIPRVLGEVDRALGLGQGVILFPEATTTGGEGVQKFRPALLEVAARSALPVGYATISYATPPGSPPAQEAVCWWGGMTFLGHIFALASLPGFRARLTFGAERFQDDDRKRLAQSLWHAVAGQFREVEIDR